MIVNETSRNPKKKAKRLNSVRGTQRFTKPSQSLGSANVVINTKDAIPKLQQLSQKYIGVNNPYGFLTDLRNALGIPNSSGASKYGEVQIPQSDGSMMKVSLRITNHNSNAETYITHNANYQFNLSILVRKKFQKNRFKPHNSVVLHEYVYYGKKMENVENPLSQIVNSIIGYLQTGTYNDTTGVAMVNKSPQQTSVQTPAANTGTTENNKTDKNESKNMNRKNTIRLTESDLKRVISESVKRVLKESDYFDGSYRDEPYDFRTQDPTDIHKHNGREIPDGNNRSFTMGSFKPIDKYKTPKPKYDEYIEDVYEWIGNAVQRLRNFDNVYTHTDENVSIHEEIEKLCFLLNRVYNELENLQYGLKEID